MSSSCSPHDRNRSSACPPHDHFVSLTRSLPSSHMLLPRACPLAAHLMIVFCTTPHHTPHDIPYEPHHTTPHHTLRTTPHDTRTCLLLAHRTILVSLQRSTTRTTLSSLHDHDIALTFFSPLVLHIHPQRCLPPYESTNMLALSFSPTQGFLIPSHASRLEWLSIPTPSRHF